MSRPRRTSKDHAETGSTFPWWVTLGSLAFVLWLFFGNTVPALRERRELRAWSDELAARRAEYDAAIQQARLGVGPNAHYDLQALLLAIDQLGYTPLELCLAHPDAAEAAGGREPTDGRDVAR